MRISFLLTYLHLIYQVNIKLCADLNEQFILFIGYK